MTLTTSLRGLAVAGLLFCLTACGLKGGLYLPAPESENQEQGSAEAEAEESEATDEESPQASPNG
jgi:predicted small lipoprotein YifL